MFLRRVLGQAIELHVLIDDYVVLQVHDAFRKGNGHLRNISRVEVTEVRLRIGGETNVTIPSGGFGINAEGACELIFGGDNTKSYSSATSLRVNPVSYVH